jgi:hypothetical protein
VTGGHRRGSARPQGRDFDGVHQRQQRAVPRVAERDDPLNGRQAEPPVVPWKIRIQLRGEIGTRQLEDGGLHVKPAIRDRHAEHARRSGPPLPVETERILDRLDAVVERQERRHIVARQQ